VCLAAGENRRAVVPFAGTRRIDGSATTWSGLARASRGVGSTPEPCVPDDPQPIGLPAARRRDLFPRPATASSTDRPPSLASRVHALVPFLPFGVPSSILPPPPFGAGRPVRVPSLFATSPTVSTRCRSFPSSRYVPSSGFLSLSTACSTIGFAGLFHPAATSRVPSPSRGFSRPAAVPTRRRALPPCRCRPPAHRQAGCHG
jgi:hypothetical protein